MKHIIVLLILIFFCVPSQALAHSTESDGDISLTIHFDPEDDPIAYQQTGFYFHFMDKTNKFKAQDCECTFTVIKGGSEIYSQPLFRDNATPSLNTITLVYTFPEKNIYQVKVTGKPTTANAFKSFAFTFDIRVERVSATQTANPQENRELSWLEKHFTHSINVVLSLAVFAAFVILAVIQKQKERKKNHKKGGEK